MVSTQVLGLLKIHLPPSVRLAEQVVVVPRPAFQRAFVGGYDNRASRADNEIELRVYEPHPSFDE